MTLEYSEKQFQSQIRDLAMTFNWLYYHTWRAIHSPAGFPDCVLVKGERLIFAELKSEKGQPTMEQCEWLEALNGVPGIEAYLWKPSDFDEIVEVLRGGN